MSLTNGLGGWFGGPPGVLQNTHPMGPSTHPSGHRGSKRVKNHSSSEPFLGRCARVKCLENWNGDSFWTKKFFEKFSRVEKLKTGPQHLLQGKSLFSCFFFKPVFFRQFAADPGLIGVKKFLLVWIFQKCPKKSGKCISDTSSLPDLFGTFRPLISALLLRLAWFLAWSHRFGLNFFHLKFHQFPTNGWPVAAVFRFENPNFRDFFRFSRIFRELATNQRPMAQFFGYPTKNAKFWYIEHACRAENRARRAGQRESFFMFFAQNPALHLLQ